MKRKISIILSIILVVSLVCAGCGSGNSANNSDVTDGATDSQGINPDNLYTDEVVKLTIWGAEEDAELLAQITSDFKAKYSQQQFEFVIGACSESDSRGAVLGDVANAADVFTFADDQLATFVASGVIKPVAYNVDEVSSRNLASSVAAATVNDKLYAYPLTADNGYFMYYNKAYFEPSDLETLDGMLSVAASKGKKVTMDVTSGWYLYSYFGNTGLEVGLNDDGISNYCTWNSVDNPIKGIDVANAIMAIASNGGFLNGGDSALIDGAKNDTVIAGVSGVWNSTTLQEIWGDNLGAVKLPTYTVAGQQLQMSSYAGYKMLGVNSYSPNREWAEIFAEFASNEDNQQLRFKLRGQGPSNIVAAASPEVTASPAIVALLQQSEFASLQRVGGNYWDPAARFGTSMINHTSDDMPLQEYLDGIVADITASNS